MSLLRPRECGTSSPTTPACRDGHHFAEPFWKGPASRNPNGVGAVRALHLVGPPTREVVVEFEPPHRLRYRLLSRLPFRDYIGEITIEPEGTGSRLSTNLRFRARILGTQFFGPIAIRLATRAAAHVSEEYPDH